MAHKLFISWEEEELVREIINDIKKNYQVEEAALPVKLELFHLLKGYDSVREYRTVRITHGPNPTCVSFIKAQFVYSTKSGPATRTSMQAYVFVTLSRDYGHLVIKKETLRDKLNELFQPLELDFEDDKQFSRRFYVLAKDKEKALYLITQDLRDELKKMRPDVYIEVINNVMMIANEQGAADESLFELLQLGCKLSGMK
jgi:hypothetical protein